VLAKKQKSEKKKKRDKIKIKKKDLFFALVRVNNFKSRIKRTRQYVDMVRFSF
jgi:hypothetical protein